MENASKALIIAGAILLSILLISLGIMIFSQAQDTVNNSGMSQAEISTFNSQFTKYEGQRKGSVVRAMINEVIASNSDANHQNNGATVNVSVKTSNGTVKNMSAGSIVTSDVENSKTYTVKCEYASNGRVNKITCE